MNCHNGEKFLIEAITSVLNQTYKNFELIFFNNFSSDKSEIIIKSINDDRIKYYSSNIFLELYSARNEAIKKAKGEYITFLDTDDLWENNKLDKQLEFFKNNLSTKKYYIQIIIFSEILKKTKSYF